MVSVKDMVKALSQAQRLVVLFVRSECAKASKSLLPLAVCSLLGAELWTSLSTWINRAETNCNLHLVGCKEE